MLIFAFSGAFAGCGEDGEPEKGKPQKVVSTESAEMDEGPAAEASVGEDLGVDCETHEYILRPGDEAGLEFQVRLGYSDLTVAGLPKKPLPEDEVKITSQNDYWEKTDAKIELSDMRLEEMPRSVTTWGVDSPELAEAQGQGNKLMRITHPGQGFRDPGLTADPLYFRRSEGRALPRNRPGRGVLLRTLKSNGPSIPSCSSPFGAINCV